MSSRPTEVKAVAALIQEEHEGPEECAKAVIALLDKLRRDRVSYAVAVNAAPVPYLYKDFDTNGEAVKWVEKNGLSYTDVPIYVVPMFSKDRVQERHTDEHHKRLLNSKKTT